MMIPMLFARRTAGVLVRRPMLAAVCGGSLLVACGGDVADTADRDARVVAPPPVGDVADTSRAPGAADGCRLAGAWQRCSVVESVERAGYRLQPLRDDVAQPGLDVRGAAYRLGPAELQIFIHRDSAAAARAAAAVNVDDAEPADTRGIRRAPAVIRSNNLVALLFDNNDRLRERVRLALAAGLPPG